MGCTLPKKKTYKTLTTSSKSFDFPDGEVLDSIVPIEEGQWRFQSTNPGNPFKDKVRCIHTDGFILEEDVNNSPLYTCSKDAFKTLKAFKFERKEECSNKKMEHDSFPFTNKHLSFIKHETYLAEIIEALKNVILAESANNPKGYIHYTAKKLLLNKESHAEKVAQIREKYSHNPDFAFKIIKVYDLYNYIPKEVPPRRKLNENEAEDIIVKLLSNKL
ncbi:hypothetical protein RclHR1_22750004 [Rhizophagus clarus]|uniref:Uncharacterized protein n=1 Tax=Rhizophagus clarus TaxID=94130 RepID=A0A2Z6QVN3_9GLOM|nr:hypothetical protein RclHR1_22750004 [Rhizophagus clarus]